MSGEHEVEFHPSAVEEARAARESYSARSERAGTGFLRELDRAIIAISEIPRRWRAHLHGTRRYLRHRYPFSVVYLELDDDTLEVVAVAHARRRPDYWRDRVP